MNVKNNLDEPLLLTWNGIQHRKNSWQDGVLGTNCPIPSGWNWTYEFQVKDQIGSFFYFPSTNFQRASGGYGGIIVNNRAIIPVPFALPDGDVTLFISDWYTKSHKVFTYSLKPFFIVFCPVSFAMLVLTSETLLWNQKLRKDVESKNGLRPPDGIVINGFGPFASNGSPFGTINVEPGIL
jgi:FtsP/CotA-like multicopper oxidase with cupredoxin domain